MSANPEEDGIMFNAYRFDGAPRTFAKIHRVKLNRGMLNPNLSCSAPFSDTSSSKSMNYVILNPTEI
jgi:hypothetical protein